MDNTAHIVVGPLLRYVGSDVATIWVETDRACSIRAIRSWARATCQG